MTGNNSEACMSDKTNQPCVVKCPGLDVETDHILEMACVITDSDMNVLKEVRSDIAIVRAGCTCVCLYVGC